MVKMWLEFVEVIVLVFDVLIIGGGPAGLTAGLYGARSGLKTLMLEEAAPGGQAALTDRIENYPGFPEGISGPELMQRFMEQAVSYGMEYKNESAKTFEDRGHTKVVFTAGQQYEASSIIIASGARARDLNVPGENEFKGRGVSYCATCDGPFFRNREVAVVGGGDAAVEEALFLTRFASRVKLIHRRDQLRAARVLQERANNNAKLQLIWNSVVEEIKGGQQVEGVQLKDLATGEQHWEPVGGVFVFIGTVPNTGFLPAAILNDKGYVTADENLRTAIPGVFAAGDVRAKFLRQVTTAVGDGALAVMAAQHYLTEK